MTIIFVFCHQMLQNDLEVEQVKVNSLTHMVVVVDENSGESATAALEEQLQVECDVQNTVDITFISTSHMMKSYDTSFMYA